MWPLQQKERFEDALTVLTSIFKKEEEAISQGMQVASGYWEGQGMLASTTSWKETEMNFPLDSLEWTQPSETPWFQPSDTDFWLLASGILRK